MASQISGIHRCQPRFQRQMFQHQIYHHQIYQDQVDLADLQNLPRNHKFHC